jgi:ssDNA-binding Zn-finger/Zn-ribbon topoisomerase 1
MTAYRDAHVACPSCGGEVHERAGHLVCTSCNAMQLTAADFAAAVNAFDGNTDTLAIFDELPDDHVCPRCRGATTTCALAIGRETLRGRFVHCAAHGVWMTQDAMTATFARASRRAHLGAGVGRTYGGAASAAPFSDVRGGFGGALRSIQSAFGNGEPADAGLGIQSGQGISHVHTVFASAYKDRSLACPHCASSQLRYEGDRWACPSCGGAFVETAALVGMVEDLTGTPFELHTAPATSSAHACPLCSTPMVVDSLEAHAVDRCATHGVWFGAHVLAAVLEHAATPEPRGSWLHRLLHRRH